jgi:protein-L-isoaspartate(D-aspartate) O-methyltransferase
VRGPFDERSSRHLMVTQQLQARDIDDERVLGAMRAVPRELFVPDELRRRAYEDAALPIGEGQTISQPYMVAAILQALALNGRERVLDVGTGSGYQAAVLAAMGAKVHGIEIIEPLAEEASERLRRLGYPVDVVHGDGWKGRPEHAPYDAILVAAAPPQIPEALKDQLRVGGRLVVPVGRAGGMQGLTVVTRTESGFTEQVVAPVAFVPLVGGPS